MQKTLAAVATVMLLATPAFADPVEYVRVCDAFGTGFFYIPGTETCVNPDTGETRRDSENGVVYGQTEVAKEAQQATEGVAIGIAMSNATVDAGKTFGAAANIGTYGGEVALGLSAAIKASDGLTFNGAVGVGLGGGNVAGRGGVNFSW